MTPWNAYMTDKRSNTHRENGVYPWVIKEGLRKYLVEDSKMVKADTNIRC